MKEIYLDWAATTPTFPVVIETMRDCMFNHYGNPSSIHTVGKDAKNLLEASRKTLSDYLGVSSKSVYFTSGGTEANSLVLASFLRKRQKGRILCSSIEHASVYTAYHSFTDFGFTVNEIPVTSVGCIDLIQLEQRLSSPVDLISIMMVNNETGSLQPLKEAVKLIRQSETGKRVHIHTDAVQALGKVPFSLQDLDIDSAAFSAHKISGPKGIGAVYLKKPVQPLYSAGGQESGLRSGTENLPAVAGFSAAITELHRFRAEEAQNLHSLLCTGLEKIGAKIIACDTTQQNSFSPWIIKASFPKVPGEILTRVLSDKGLYVSTGSACSSNKKMDARVLLAMGYSKVEAFESIRISTGWSTSVDDITDFLLILETEYKKLKKSLS